MAVAAALLVAACGGGESSSDGDPDAPATDAPTTAAPTGTDAAVDTDAAPDTDAPPETDEPAGSDTTDAPPPTEGADTTDAAPASDVPPATDAPAELDCSQATASAPGVTEDTIRIGFTSVDLTSLFGTGFVTEITPEQFVTRQMSVFDAINRAGGINCRQIEWVQSAYDPTRAAETQVPACERLAQDEEVFLVYAAFPDSAGGGVDCLWDRFGIPIVTNGPTPQATIDAAEGRVLGIRPSVEVMTATAMQTYIDLGLLDGQTVAVLGGDSGELGLGQQAGVAYLREAGIDPIDVVLPSSGGTVATWGVAPQVVASLVEQGVTTVIVFGSSVTMGPFYDEMKANGADWQWLTVDTQSFGGTQGTSEMPDDWRGIAVTSQLHEPRTSDADVACAAAYEQMRASGDYPDEWFEDFSSSERGNTNTTRSLSIDCAMAQVVAAALDGAGLNPTRESLVEAMNSIGPIDIAYETAGTVEPGKGFVSDTARVYRQYPSGSAECLDLGYFEDLPCWGPYGEGDPGVIENVVPG